MTAATLERQPAPSGGSAPGTPEPSHIVCCDDDIAICGEDVTGDEWAEQGDDSLVCPMCALMLDEGLPCPVPGCPGGGPEDRRPTS